MTRWMTCVLTAVIAFVAIPAARADVSWNFIVTAATDLGCPTCHLPLPDIGGSLTLFDAAVSRGGVSYAYAPNPGADTMEAFGDTDFNLQLGAFGMPLNIGAFLGRLR